MYKSSTMQHTIEDKLSLECQKLDEEVKKLKVEVKNIQRPFFRQPSTIWGAVPLLISVALNLQQCSKTKNAEEMSKIELASAKLNTLITKVELDSLDKSKKELEANIVLAKIQVQSVVDSVNKRSETINQFIASTPSSPAKTEAIADLQQTISNINKVGKYAVANIEMKSSSFKVSAVKDVPLAKSKWIQGFTALVNNEIEKAISAFTEAENACNGYHHAYELARYLRSKANIASDLEGRKVILRKVVSDYSGFAPKESIDALKKELTN